METKIKSYDLKIPSSPVVTMNNCWEILKIIAKTGKVFLDTDLVKNGSPVNEKNLFRVLAYLKYLGLLYEKREREESNGKSLVVQRWYEKEEKRVTDFFFFLRDNRESQAKEIFVEIIRNHDLYKAISEDLLKLRPSATKIELKDYLRRKIPGKSPGYYDTGVKSTIEVLSFCNLIEYDGNLIRVKKESNEEEVSSESQRKTEEKNPELPKKELGNNKYMVSIYGENTNFQFPVNNQDDIIDVEAVLGIIKRKLP